MKIDKEKLLVVTVAAVGIGALLALQHFTTPHQRRHRSGGAPTGSSAHGAAHGRHTSHLQSGAPHGEGKVAPPTNAVNGTNASHDRRCASRGGSRLRHASADASGPRNRSRSQHAPHLPHVTAAGPAGGGGLAQRRGRRTGSHAPPHDRAQSPPVSADAVPAAPLTIELLSAHYKREGTMGCVGERLASPDPAAHHEYPPFPDEAVAFGASGDGMYRLQANMLQRSPSNAATVGSKSLEGTGAAAMGKLQLAPAVAAHQMPQQQNGSGHPRHPVHAAVAAKTPRQRVVGGSSAAVTTGETPDVEHDARKDRSGAAVQTDPLWFSENRATQTEPPPSTTVDGTAQLTPCRPGTASKKQILATDKRRRGESVGGEASDLALSPIVPVGVIEDLDSPAPTPVVKRGGRSPLAAGTQDEDDDGDTDSADDDAGAQSTFIPRYLLLDAERQLNAVISSIHATAPHNAPSWMVLYCYLKELPPASLTQMRERERLFPLPPLPSPTSEQEGPSTGVEGLSDLQCEVQGLLSGDEVAIANTTYYYKWKGSRIVRRDGNYTEALAKKLATDEERRRNGGGARFPVPERFAHIAIDDDEQQVAEGEQNSPSLSDADAVMTVVKRYAFVTMQGAATQTEVSLESPMRASTQTPLKGAPSMLQDNQVAELLQRLVTMKRTAEFEALRYGQQNALFACDFIEVAAEAQRLLDAAGANFSANNGHASSLSRTQPPTMFKTLGSPDNGDDSLFRNHPNNERSPLPHDVTPSPKSSFQSHSGLSGQQRPRKPSLQGAFRRGGSSTSALGMIAVKGSAEE